MKEVLQSEGKKGDLLLASLDLFSHRGYDGVSVRDIAKQAGVSEAALYKHFSGKEDLALYIFRKIISEYTEKVKAIVEEDSSAADRLVKVQQYTYGLYRQDEVSIRFVLLSQYKFWDLVEDEIKPHFLLKRLLLEGMEKKEISSKPVYLWISIYSGLLLEPLVQYSFFGDEFPEWDEFVEQVGETIRHTLMPG